MANKIIRDTQGFATAKKCHVLFEWPITQSKKLKQRSSMHVKDEF